MLTWIQENRAEYLESYSDIGEDLESVEDLEEDHKQFEANCVVNLLFIINDIFIEIIRCKETHASFFLQRRFEI